ncbi:MAG: DUF368 domain-containing protein, partial [Pseudohongiellaceae bacterium]
VYKKISRFGVDLVFACGLGAAVGMVITTVAPVELAPTPLFIFAAGAVAVCAWILPGLSGSFILLVLGLYAMVIDAVEQLDLATLSILGAGCAIGLVTFSQVLSRLFRYFRDETLAVLTGFMLGSLIKLWPWKHTLSYQLREDGRRIPLVEEPVLPSVYASITGHEPEIPMAIVAVLVGFVLVLLMDWLSERSANS